MYGLIREAWEKLNVSEIYHVGEKVISVVIYFDWSFAFVDYFSRLRWVSLM